MYQKLKSRVNRIAKNEEGSVSMYIIIFMVFFLPFAIWVGVQLPLKFEATYAVKQMTSNTADSIISRLDQDALARGSVQVNLNEARSVAGDMIRGTLNLDANFYPSGEGLLKERIPVNESETGDFEIYTIEDIETLPKEDGEYILPRTSGVYVYVINNPNSPIYIQGLLPIDNTSVVVRANIPVENGGLLGGRAVITRTGVSEAQIHTGSAS